MSCDERGDVSDESRGEIDAAVCELQSELHEQHTRYTTWHGT